MRIFFSILLIYSFRGCVVSKVIIFSRVDALSSEHCSLNRDLCGERRGRNEQRLVSSRMCRYSVCARAA